ncbi:MAG: signal peptidase, partial [Pirellulaceae bacterium]
MPKYVVRHGSMRLLTIASTRNEFRRGMRVVVRTNRGMETGDVLSVATEQSTKQLKSPGSGQIVREMTTEDDNEMLHIKGREAE